MKRRRSRKIQTEIICPACEGSGFPPVKQPIEPGRKIYPAPCPQCLGKGRITLDPTQSPERPALGTSNQDQEVAYGLPEH